MPKKNKECFSITYCGREGDCVKEEGVITTNKGFEKIFAVVKMDTSYIFVPTNGHTLTNEEVESITKFFDTL